MQLVVLGMHRAGTSAVTGSLQLMGAYFGPEALALAPNDENPKGFWERKDVHSACDGLMRGAGAQWWRVSDFDVESIPADVREQELARLEQTVAELDAHRPWVVKEPQLCLLLPLLRPLLDSPVAVLVHREPLEIALSLQRRAGFPLQFGLALWEAYARSALAVSRDIPRVLVRYGDLVASPVAALAGLADELAHHGVAGLSVPTEEDARSFVTPQLYRNRVDPRDRATYLTPEQLRLAAALDGGLADTGTHTTVLSEDAGEALARHERAFEQERGSSVMAERVVLEQFRAELRQASEAHSRSEAEVAQERLRADSLETELLDARTRVETLARRHRRLARRHRRLRRSRLVRVMLAARRLRRAVLQRVPLRRAPVTIRPADGGASLIRTAMSPPSPLPASESLRER